MTAVMPTYGRYDIAFDRGEGPYLFTADGRRYLDFAAGIATNSLGHAHPHLVEVLREQAGKLWHVSNLYRIPDQERLAERLCEASFADRAFFCNSGAEACEGALKVARKYQSETGHPERWRVIACHGAFHGRTMSTLAAAGNEKYLKGFGPVVEGFTQVPFGNMNELRQAITPETGAIIVEPVQGEGGVRAASLQFLRELRAVADEFGLVLIFDEVQCGVGRTGKLFAHEWAGVTPDVLATAKGLGGGFPVGAILATEKVAVGMVAGSHGSTFGGNPLAMAVGNAVLDIVLAPGFLDRVARVAEHAWTRFSAIAAAHPATFAELRGAGLLLGLRCATANAPVIDAFRGQGLLTVGAAENVVRLVPPLIIEEAHVDEAAEMMTRAVSAKAAA